MKISHKTFSGISVKYSGILKLSFGEVISEAILAHYNSQLPGALIDLSPSDIHVTLCHQGVLKAAAKKLKEADFSNFTPPEFELEDEIRVAEDGDKKAAFVRVKPKYWDALKGMTNAILQEHGIQPYLYVREFEREHHISLANRSGNPRDSIAFTWRHDPGNASYDWPYEIEPCEAVLDKDLSGAM